MAKYKFILDRQERKDGTNTVMLSFRHGNFRRQVSLGIKIRPENWNDGTSQVLPTEKNYRHFNYLLANFSNIIDGVLLRHYCKRSDGPEIFKEIESAVFPEKTERDQQLQSQSETLLDLFDRFASLKRPSTRLTYNRTQKHVEKFVQSGNSKSLDEINKTWLTAFDNYLSASNPSANARALHFRNLRAVFNFALEEELTKNYPFRRFKIKTVRTDKRNMPVETLRKLLEFPVEDWQTEYLDMFKLSFMLIGINFADMLNLKKGDLRDGRIVYNRHKTSRLYSIKVEPETRTLIEKYSGQEHLLSIMDSRSDYLQYVRQTNNALRKIGPYDVIGRGGKKDYHPISPELSTYWARHTWATIAASLDIPKETIAAALGHGGNTVTDIYIDFDRKKVDAANRAVLDYVLYNIK